MDKQKIGLFLVITISALWLGCNGERAEIRKNDFSDSPSPFRKYLLKDPPNDPCWLDPNLECPNPKSGIIYYIGTSPVERSQEKAKESAQENAVDQIWNTLGDYLKQVILNSGVEEWQASEIIDDTDVKTVLYAKVLEGVVIGIWPAEYCIRGYCDWDSERWSGKKWEGAVRIEFPGSEEKKLDLIREALRIKECESAACRRAREVVAGCISDLGTEAIRDAFDARAESTLGLQCENNEACSEDEYCEFPDGECMGPGVCAWKPEICTMHLDPVCGCDGLTKSNRCVAAAFGISIAYKGHCVTYEVP